MEELFGVYVDYTATVFLIPTKFWLKAFFGEKDYDRKGMGLYRNGECFHYEPKKK